MNKKKLNNLDLGVIGNCNIGALVDQSGSIVWCCLPRFDGDPVFNALLDDYSVAPTEGVFAIELADLQSCEQRYEPNTAILKTVLHGPSGSIEITDCTPRFYSRGRLFRPQSIVRRVVPLSGRPRVTIRIKPNFDFGKVPPTITYGSNHIRYVGPRFAIRVNTDASVDHVVSETEFNLTKPLSFLLGPDETLGDGIWETAREFEEKTAAYWRVWSRRLALPFEWQDAVIRAAITLKLCTYEPTGAIVAALTTSVPEAPDSGRNWDYRYCWLRDAFFVVRALNSLGAVSAMEHYFDWLMNVVSYTADDHMQPVLGVGFETELTERVIDSLEGYRGMGPVRIGNQAYEHLQHDVYGNVILGAAQAFFDRRLLMNPGRAEFERLEVAGERAFRLHDQPDAGMWELRSRARIHTSSSLMCWAACDRLANIAAHLGFQERTGFWRQRATHIKEKILKEAWSEERKAFVESFGGTSLDASVLLMVEVGFIDPLDPRFVSTVEKLEQTLARGHHMMRYESEDDYGRPETAFNICAFWRIDALAKIGRKQEAREIYEALLDSCNHLGLLSEDTDPKTGEMWGNYPQTYSMVGIINGAMRLSRPWESVV